MSLHESISVVAETAGRLDRILAEAVTTMSRARMQALIADGQVKVDDKDVRDSNFRVKPGQRINMSIPPAVEAQPLPEHIDLQIVYEDKDLIVIDKPAGLVVHPGAGNENGTLVNALIAHCGDSLSGIGGVKRPGIVHRIDKETSGLLVVAKNDGAHQGLSEQFQAHGRDGRMEREYLAFVWGAPNRPSGTISTGIARSTANRQKMAVSRSATAKEAITHYKMEASFGKPPIASLIRCTLETGRTHQIRVHLTHIGHPLLGDTAYGSGFKSSLHKLETNIRKSVNALKGQALHAAVLGFDHPRTGKHLRFESPLPPPLANLHQHLLVTSATEKSP
jgi:23S rRNA pseudouridine1911/1915/1917 synthase